MPLSNATSLLAGDHEDWIIAAGEAPALSLDTCQHLNQTTCLVVQFHRAKQQRRLVLDERSDYQRPRPHRLPTSELANIVTDQIDPRQDRPTANGLSAESGVS